MGAKTYDFEASEHKIRREQQKYKHTKVMGFCIPGMQVKRIYLSRLKSNSLLNLANTSILKVYNLKTQVYICKGKDYGKKLTSESVKDGK